MLSMLSRLGVFFSTCEALGSWVMGHAEAPTFSSWAPTAFGRSRCGGAVGVGSLGTLGGPLGTWDRCTGADSGFPIWQVHRKELQAGVDIDRSELFEGRILTDLAKQQE
jgi:hypothetical protein